MTSGLKFRMWEVEGLYYPCSENKGTDQLRSYCAPDLRLCFRTCKSRFSHYAAHIVSVNSQITRSFVNNKKFISNPKNCHCMYIYVSLKFGNKTCLNQNTCIIYRYGSGESCNSRLTSILSSIFKLTAQKGFWYFPHENVI